MKKLIFKHILNYDNFMSDVANLFIKMSYFSLITPDIAAMLLSVIH